LIFGVMDETRTVSGEDMAADPEPALEPVQRPRAWSVARLIELLDEAIDAAGVQLARSDGLWADTAGETPVARQPRHGVPRRRPVRRSEIGRWPPTTESLMEGSPVEREVELP
jgi:hypothetical protein